MTLLDNYSNLIIKKIDELMQKYSNFILVFKGFNIIDIPKENKYFDYDLPNLDILEWDYHRQLTLNTVFNYMKDTTEYKYLWMTMEEYYLYSEYKNIESKQIVVLENNIYGKYFPYFNTLSNIEKIYQTLYYQDSNELSFEEEQKLELISNFYGKIEFSKKTGQYYLAYNDVDEDLLIESMFEVIPYTPEHILEEIEFKIDYQVKISEDEIPFLDMTQYLISNESETNVLFIINQNENIIFQNIYNRIYLLSKLTNVSIYFMSESIKRNTIERLEDYKKILKDNYGYENFKNIEFYTSITSRNKETVEISQAQIIDDIITQSELAMENKIFNDVYITASTGAGKSLMFQIPALYLTKTYPDDTPLTLIISPLIGLMNDQVDSMKKKGITTAETINGNTLPYERERIIQKIKESKVHLLYLSPETLQARSDIKQIIGERRIGLVIIDEAHIVTTWGKSFRADYWYLGIYLKKLRKISQFPIVTFTATAIYGGPEDMYLDTRESLSMLSPISYFGKVKRDDLFLDVQSAMDMYQTGDRDYKLAKNCLALRHLRSASLKKEKSLIYFPTVKLLQYFYNFIRSNAPEIFEKTGQYYGSLDKEQKNQTLIDFQNGDIQFVLATKAFGMGIDIPDIKNVYHYAPTGNVVDYIQEIGRAARSNGMIGYGVIDFLKPDFGEVNKLHGMSAIRKDQIIEVMKKIVQVYRERNSSRNLLVSAEDFKYIFEESERDDNSDLDNKVKTILLMIEKDFASPNKIGFEPFAARPRSLFANDLILVNKEIEQKLLTSTLKGYLNKKYNLSGNAYNAVYEVNLAKIWENYYQDFTYPSFKYHLYKSDKREKLKHSSIFNNFIFGKGIEIQMNDSNYSAEEILQEYKKIFNSLRQFFNSKKMSEKYFSIEDLANHFRTSLKISDFFKAKIFSQVIINSIFSFMNIKQVHLLKIRDNYQNTQQTYKFIGQDIDVFENAMMVALKDALFPTKNFVKQINDSIMIFFGSTHSEKFDLLISSLGIGNSLGLLGFQVQGGNTPKIYIRMNTITPLLKAINQGTNYNNNILETVYTNHKRSVAMLKYLFLHKVEADNRDERIMKYTEWFWNTIEDYFMGILPELDLTNKY